MLFVVVCDQLQALQLQRPKYGTDSVALSSLTYRASAVIC